MAVRVRNSTKCHLGQHSLKSKESWLENILKVFVCIVSTQAHLVQSVHCVQRGCGLPSRGPVSRFPATVRHSPVCSQSSLHFSLRNVPRPFQTDAEKYNYGHAIASLFSHGILKSNCPAEVHEQPERKIFVWTNSEFYRI